MAKSEEIDHSGQLDLLTQQLAVCNGQLNQLNSLISEDPSNQELLQLQVQLRSTIKLLEDTVSSNCQEYSKPEGGANPLWQVGQQCYAPRLFDQRFALARILKFEPGSERCWVTWEHPRHRYEQACKWYKQGTCRNMAEECKFSHGVETEVSSLRSIDDGFEESLLARASIIGAEVLVKFRDGLWYDAIVDAVMDSDVGDTSFAMVHFKGFGDSEDHFKVPLSRADITLRNPVERKDDDGEDIVKELSVSSYSSKFDVDADSESDEDEFMPRQLDEVLTQDSLKKASSEGLFTDAYVVGEWEQHTKGIGSKLLARMGYVRGFGLGTEKKGIVRPIPVRVLPHGVSLDFLDKVPAKEPKEKKKKKRKHGWQGGRDEIKTDVFNLLNTKIAPHHSLGNSPSQTASNDKKHLSSKMKKEDLQRHILSSKDEQVAIKKKIKKLEESLDRNKDHAGFAAQLSQQLNKAKHRLNHLQAKSTKAEEVYNEKRHKKKSKKSYF